MSRKEATPEQLAEFEKRLDAFEAWFTARNGGRLERFEKAILRTYMFWEEQDGEAGNGSDRV